MFLVLMVFQPCSFCSWFLPHLFLVLMVFFVSHVPLIVLRLTCTCSLCSWFFSHVPCAHIFRLTCSLCSWVFASHVPCAHGFCLTYSFCTFSPISLVFIFSSYMFLVLTVYHQCYLCSYFFFASHAPFAHGFSPMFLVLRCSICSIFLSSAVLFIAPTFEQFPLFS